MKSKLLVSFSTIVMALALMAQSATQTPPAAGDQPKGCACCNHDQAAGKMACSGKDCCKDGKCDMMSKDGKDAMTHEHMMSGDDKSAPNKCPMMAKDGKMSCWGEDGGCCKDGKCNMAKDRKSCCDGKQCAGPQTGA
jgi:hypothetical protein